MFSVVVLCVVFVVAFSVVTFAVGERASLAKEVETVAVGVERCADFQCDTLAGKAARPSTHLNELVDEAVQTQNCQLAVLAVNELGSRADLRRTRALLLSRGLPRIALLSGGGGAFLIAAGGNFSRTSLGYAAGSVLVGLACSFSCVGLTAANRRLAREYVGIVDALAREVERHTVDRRRKT